MPELRLIQGFALDLTTKDSDGRLWDFDEEEMQKRALARVCEERPMLLIGSPMCTAFSRLQNMNLAKMKRKEVNKVSEHGTKHLEFCMHLYKLQHSLGLYFLHEHREQATSWSNPVVREVMS